MKMMKNKQRYVVLLVGAALLLPASVTAATFISHDVVAPSDSIADDLYAAGERVQLRQPIEEDVFVAGRLIEVATSVGGDIMAAGETVELAGQSDDDVFAAGSRVTGTGLHADDLFVASSDVTLDADTVVNGDAYLAGASITLGGTYAGTVRMAGDRVRILEGTTIRGDLITYGEARPVIEEGATIEGTTRHFAPEVMRREATAYTAVLAWVRGLLMWFVAGLLLVLLLPRLATLVTDQARHAPLASFGVGLVWYVLLIPVCILLLMTVIGVPLVFVLLGTSIMLIPLSMAAATLLAGQWAGQYIMPRARVSRVMWQQALLGALLLKLIRVVPLVGGLVTLVLVVTASGALLRVLWQILGTHRRPAAETVAAAPEVLATPAQP